MGVGDGRRVDSDPEGAGVEPDEELGGTGFPTPAPNTRTSSLFLPPRLD